MALLASISGIRGTIGGSVGTNLTPVDVVGFAAAYASWLKSATALRTVVVGRDARPSGPLISSLVCNTLQAAGLHVLDLGLSTTPTVEMAVPWAGAAGGIVITASHNPAEWNALKLLNAQGEFISATAGESILQLYHSQQFDFVPTEQLGSYTSSDEYLARHLDAIVALPLVDVEAIRAKNFRVALDCVNSTGGIFVPALLQRLGVNQQVALNCIPNGNFTHNPEPLRENLDEICSYVATHPLHLGIVVDPDVDRLVFVMENGELFGEEYTLVAIADYVLSLTPGAAVSNLSSTRALKDVALWHNCKYVAAAVGEVNVVEKMKQQHAVIGGEGNGGIIYPVLHYGRDALVGIALFLSFAAQQGVSLTQLRQRYPNYYMAKHKLLLTKGIDADQLLHRAQQYYKGNPVDTTDGLKIDFVDSWLHLRKSNTEPILRIYTEAPTQQAAQALAEEASQLLTSFLG